MQLKQKGKVFALILLASAIFSLFSITFGLFPPLGLSISFITFTFLAYYIKSNKTKLTKILFLITLILSLFLSIRSEEFLTFLNIIGIFYFGSLFVLAKKEYPSESAVSILFAPFRLVLTSLFTRNEYHLEFKDAKTKEERRENALNTAAVTLTTLVVLAIIIPLLSSANPFFKKLFSDIMVLLGLQNLKITENIFQWILRLIVFSLLTLFVPKMATFINKNNDSKNYLTEGINMLMPKIAVSIVLIIFFITQFQLYFATPDTLANLGYTLSQYTNEVFAQLTAVAAIVIALIYSDKESKKINNKLALVLAFQGIFLTFMAFKSDLEYINAWGFTYKRLYGLAVASLVLGVFIIYLFTFLKNIKKGYFLISSVIYTGIILLLVNIINFDYLIYHYRKAATGQGVDYEYLTRLSSDALSYKNLLYEITKGHAQNPTESEKQQAIANGLWTLLFKIDRLQEKYGKLDVRGFNLLEYLQYKDIREVDTKTIRGKYEPLIPDGTF